MFKIKFCCGFLCERDILLASDRKFDMRVERYVFFSETSTSRQFNVVLHHTHTHTLTNTITFTHTHDWPTVASRASGSRGDFSGFANIFDHKRSARIFQTARGSRNIRKYYPQRVNCFFLFMLVFLRRHYAAKVFDDQVLTCHVRAHCWK